MIIIMLLSMSKNSNSLPHKCGIKLVYGRELSVSVATFIAPVKLPYINTMLRPNAVQ